MTSPGSVIVASDLKKVYHIYDNPRDRLKELLSFTGKKYYREFPAVDGIDFEVGRGECVGIIGQNGCGKSTLLQMVCGILKPTSGSIATTGRISALLELGTGFNPEFTGRENIFLSSALMGFKREEIEARYKDIVDFADIGDFIEQPIKTYSSGMYVRLAFACAVNVDPDILIVDEALSVGDIFFQQKCFRKIAEFRERGKTMLLVSHSMDVILKNCGKAIFLDKGRIRKAGEPNDVVNHYMEHVLSPRDAVRAAPVATAFPGPAVGPAPADSSGAADEKKTGDMPARRPSALDDNCRKKKNYNTNEFRYGNFKARITDFSILDMDGREMSVMSSGSVMRFRYEVTFDEKVESPIYGLTMKTKDGLEVYGNNSWYIGLPFEPKGGGDKVVVEFRHRLCLASGDYFISAGVAELEGNIPVPVDRRYDLAYINILPVDKSFGIANLFTEASITSAEAKEGV
jgi:ABC-type polysaccharide/polyol phosphate transport system ATPase subunit